MKIEPEKIYLTRREAQIVQLMAQGNKYEDVASILRISRNTVKFHVVNVHIKLNANNMKEAVAISFQNGFI